MERGFYEKWIVPDPELEGNFRANKKGLEIKPSETLVFVGGSNRIRTASRMG